MALPFRKKISLKTMQEYQKEHDQLMYQLGVYERQRQIHFNEANKLHKAIRELHEKMDKIAEQASKAHKLAQEELAKKIKEGKGNEQATTATPQGIE